MAKLLVLSLPALIVALLVSPSSFAASADRCHRLRVESPENGLYAKARTELWCYRRLASPAGALFIYNADQRQVRQELAILLEKNRMLTHASLLAGRVTTHRIHADQFNPFTVPLAEPATAAQVGAPVDEASADEALKLLLSHRPDAAAVTFSVFDDSLTAATANVRPWRGFWWPYKGRFLQRGPYARFDRFVQARTGRSAGTVAWEDTNHVFRGIWWEGHCNGWAAASVLRPEPMRARVDAASGVVFSVSDQKAYFTGIDYCVNSAFFGERYRGGRNNPRDILPHVFHKTLLYYIGSLRKPVAIDYRADVAVDNHIISGYQMSIVPAGPQAYNVTATLTVHKYDGRIIDVPGVAPTYTRVYRYTLRTDAAGNPVGGSWITENPDFLWVPLSPRRCDINNPNLRHEWVSEIMSLPLR